MVKLTLMELTLFGKTATTLVMRTTLPCLGGQVKYLLPLMRPSVFPAK
jgi:hypothetical protein